MAEVFINLIKVVCVCEVIKVLISLIMPENKLSEIISTSVNVIITFEVMKCVIDVIKSFIRII